MSCLVLQVVIFSYQCSQLSTPEGVIDVFKNAQTFQDKQKGTTSYVSVVVLDEVGLAEDSPNLPLKALHPLLEDGTEGADDSQQVSCITQFGKDLSLFNVGIFNFTMSFCFADY